MEIKTQSNQQQKQQTNYFSDKRFQFQKQINGGGVGVRSSIPSISKALAIHSRYHYFPSIFQGNHVR